MLRTFFSALFTPSQIPEPDCVGYITLALFWGTCRLPELNFCTPDKVLLRQLRRAGQQQVGAGTLTAAGHRIHYLRAEPSLQRQAVLELLEG